ncbi:MAG: DUF2203 domain-containing protein [Chloroflexi bacterium]|nr:DUF2203 domain-containing protein [Chloroflexota bacterium]
MDMARSYTVDEARATLPTVRATLIQLALERRRTDLDRDERRSTVQALVDHLASLGIVLRDLDSGLVDFPTVRDGEPAWLCWRLDDPDIAYWHSTREGYASRRAL